MGTENQIKILPSVGAFCAVLVIPIQTPMKEELRP
jgi:hypothetical protein